VRTQKRGKIGGGSAENFDGYTPIFPRLFHGSKRWLTSTKILGFLSPTACAVVRVSKQQKKVIFDDQVTMTPSNTIKNASISSFKAPRSNAKRKQRTSYGQGIQKRLKTA